MRCLVAFVNVLDIKESGNWHWGKYFTVKGKRHKTQLRDPYAVVVKKSVITVGHLPNKISRMCSLFLMRGGEFSCT